MLKSGDGKNYSIKSKSKTLSSLFFLLFHVLYFAVSWLLESQYSPKILIAIANTKKLNKVLGQVNEFN